MNDMITVYYYTAWDGFAWQGCDEGTAKSLQGYMEATRTLPRSSVDEPPFGGAVPCKIAGEVGVAVYRYHTRVKGDLSGRDSLYVALAFIPLSTSCVDFSKVLELRQLSEPQPGELRPEKVSADGLRLEDVSQALCHWLDKDITDTEYHILKGRNGLRKLSALFFSKYTQLGFLNAVFRSESGIDGIVSTQSYSVYPEVTSVREASDALKEARRTRGGVLDQDNEYLMRMRDALGSLYKWWEKQRGYNGLKEYHDAKQMELSDEADRLNAIAMYNERLEKAFDALPRDFSPDINAHDECVRRSAEQCLSLAKEIVKLPALEHESYKRAVTLSMEALDYSARILGCLEDMHLVQMANEAKNKAESDLEECRSSLSRSECEKDLAQREVKKQGQKLDEMSTMMSDYQSKLSDCKSKLSQYEQWAREYAAEYDALHKEYEKRGEKLEKMEEELGRLRRKLKSRGRDSDEPDEGMPQGGAESPSSDIVPTPLPPSRPKIHGGKGLWLEILMMSVLLSLIIFFVVLLLNSLVFDSDGKKNTRPPEQNMKEKGDKDKWLALGEGKDYGIESGEVEKSKGTRGKGK